MYERWEAVGSGQRGTPFEIEPGVDVFAFQWLSDPSGSVQMASSATGPFIYVPVYMIKDGGRKIIFGAREHDVGLYTFYRRLWPNRSQ